MSKNVTQVDKRNPLYDTNSLHVKGNRKYKEVTLPIAATFVSKHKSARIILEPIEQKDMPDGTVRMIPDTGLMVKFEANYARISNEEVVKKLLAHKNFNQPKYGFFPDEEDPTGFWAALGVVEEVHIPKRQLSANAQDILNGEVKFDKKLKDTLSKISEAKSEIEESPEDSPVTEEATA